MGYNIMTIPYNRWHFYEARQTQNVLKKPDEQRNGSQVVSREVRANLDVIDECLASVDEIVCLIFYYFSFEILF